MHRIRNLFYILITMLMITSCIKLYDPEILAEDEKKIVISGQVSAGDSIQKVNVSIGSPIEDPEFLPLDGCQVEISDDRGHIFIMQGIGNGDFVTSIDPVFLIPGVPFKVSVITPDGDQIESDLDTLPKGPVLDTVYYIREDHEGNTPGQFSTGIQFYVDLRATETDSRYYRWEAIETWEYHSPRANEWWYDGLIHHEVPPDSSLWVCWTTKRVPAIFTLPTDNLKENRYEMFPLHFVSNKTSRLSVGYSLFVRQSALSREAFTYWEQLRINSDPQGGLYEKQPLAIRGNMHNLTHPEKEVLGYFSAATVSEKRIFITPIPDLPLDYPIICDRVSLRFGLREILPRDYPAYLEGNETNWVPSWLFSECVDCRLLGGVTIKPVFWPY